MYRRKKCPINTNGHRSAKGERPNKSAWRGISVTCCFVRSSRAELDVWIWFGLWTANIACGSSLVSSLNSSAATHKHRPSRLFVCLTRRLLIHLRRMKRIRCEVNTIRPKSDHLLHWRPTELELLLLLLLFSFRSLSLCAIDPVHKRCVWSPSLTRPKEAHTHTNHLSNEKQGRKSLKIRLLACSAAVHKHAYIKRSLVLTTGNQLVDFKPEIANRMDHAESISSIWVNFKLSFVRKLMPQVCQRLTWQTCVFGEPPPPMGQASDECTS